MTTISREYPRVSAIIAAYNEQDTVAPVVRRLVTHLLVDEVIVVSDGSTDRTAERAREAGADVVELERNMGKGEAMAAGVLRARHDVLLFADADLIGLTDSMITLLIQKVCREGYDMFTLIRQRAPEMIQLYLPAEYGLGGERTLHRSLWNRVAPEDRRGFGVELALNYAAMQAGMSVGQELAPGLRQVIKERKRGLIMGFIMRMQMVGQCLVTFCRLFLLNRPHAMA